MYQIYL
jgi:hypothetical protein